MSFIIPCPLAMTGARVQRLDLSQKPLRFQYLKKQELLFGEEWEWSHEAGEAHRFPNHLEADAVAQGFGDLLAYAMVLPNPEVREVILPYLDLDLVPSAYGT